VSFFDLARIYERRSPKEAGMKRLVFLLCIAMLGVPGVAAAKELQGVELCGSDGCQQQRNTQHREDPGSFGGSGGIVPPAAPAPFYRGNLLIGEGGKVHMRIPFFYVPDAKLIVEPGGRNQPPSWWRPEGALITIVESLAARIRPNPAPTDIRVTANGKPVAAPQSYLRLFTIGSKTDRYPTEDTSVQLTFVSAKSTPWSSGNMMFLYPKSDLLVRDGQFVALSSDTSDRIVRGASLASGSSFPWLPAAAGLAAVVLAALLVRRLRPRAAPRPVTQH
jgi:hypothetical protein